MHDKYNSALAPGSHPGAWVCTHCHPEQIGGVHPPRARRITPFQQISTAGCFAEFTLSEAEGLSMTGGPSPSRPRGKGHTPGSAPHRRPSPHKYYVGMRAEDSRRKRPGEAAPPAYLCTAHRVVPTRAALFFSRDGAGPPFWGQPATIVTPREALPTGKRRPWGSRLDSQDEIATRASASIGAEAARNDSLGPPDGTHSPKTVLLRGGAEMSLFFGRRY